jgi:hypothetical protein
MKRIFTALTLCLLAYTVAYTPDGLAQSARLPPVEINHGGGLREWAGRTLRDIIPPATVKRIVRIRESGFAAHHDNSRPDFSSRVQADYDDFMARLMQSEEKAREWGQDALEGEAGRLIVLTGSGEIYDLEILGRLGEITVVILRGTDKAARFGVKGVRRPWPKIQDLRRPNKVLKPSRR